jgi:hypothetical protein
LAANPVTYTLPLAPTAPLIAEAKVNPEGVEVKLVELLRLLTSVAFAYTPSEAGAEIFK